ncbi:hypothetical protein AR457_39865 [Streptomyces agglomeratus]|uniref:hypothetical protein n=1 Tax=Streptomyces agglomeratus TaxID=285458 RepID=UPI000852760C|nr:hypothetical protein [Streptomyces agglomeratus]OEJ22054.1 hypothetical protein AR457_39865 [Streptomyces agglomeratus]OEJ36891.1 hypothetical protein BGK70_00520 [Streptomyces agglomeratus]
MHAWIPSAVTPRSALASTASPWAMAVRALRWVVAAVLGVVAVTGDQVGGPRRDARDLGF